MTEKNETTSALGKTASEMKTLGQVLEARKAEFAKVLPKHLSADKLIKIAVNCVSRTPDLQKCTIDSVLRCVYIAAELGLEPGSALGHFYLVPFGGVATAIIGYRGLIKLAHNSGEVVSIRAVVVREKDKFRYREGLEQAITHEPYLDGDAGPLTRVYAVALLRSGERTAEFMTRTQVDAIRARSRAGKNGPWVTDYEEMAKKTVTRRLCKYLPLGDQARDHLDRDDDVIDGEVVEREGETVIQSATERASKKARTRLGLIQDIPGDNLEAQLAASVAATSSVPSEAEKAEILRREAEQAKAGE